MFLRGREAGEHDISRAFRQLNMSRITVDGEESVEEFCRSRICPGGFHGSPYRVVKSTCGTFRTAFGGRAGRTLYGA